MPNDNTEQIRSPSPCEKCQITNCHTKCIAWRKWFGERWRATRKLFGIEDVGGDPSSAAEISGDRLRCVRFKAGLSQKELATRAGLSKEMVYIYEAGRKRPSPKSLLRLADALGVKVDELTEQEGDQK